jgi:hypothetical protein
VSAYCCPECGRPEGQHHQADCSQYAAIVRRPLIYLSGCRVGEEAIGRLRGVGYLLTPRMGQRPAQGVVWAADNGCFSQPEAFDLDAYFVWLDALTPFAGACLFATAPDVVGDARATLARSLPVLPQLRDAGYRAALVAQDGLEHMEVPWDAFDALFIGGSTRWKLSEGAAALARHARSLGKWVHMGRVNSLRRLRIAETMGCHSADGTFLKYGPNVNLPRLSGWLRELAENPLLPGIASLVMGAE